MNKKGGAIRIAILVTGFPPDFIGGTETQSLNLSKNLGKRHDVTVITKRVPGSLNCEVSEGFFIRRFRCLDLPVIRFFSHILFSLNEIRKLRKEIDILQCMMVMPNGLVGVLAKMLFGLPAVTWIRGSDWYVGSRSRLVGPIISFVVRNSDMILAQTKTIRDDILREFPNAKVKVMPNGIEPSRERSSGSGIVFVGRLIKVKGVEYLIEAIRLLKVRQKATIVGYGTSEPKLKSMAKGLNIEFTGKVQPGDVKKYMKRAGIFVLPSIIEGFPNVILEAMSLGLPVISTNVGGIPDVVVDKKTGFLVKPRDPKAIANCIERLMNDQSLRKRMGKNALMESKKYEWKNILPRLEKIYRSLI